MHVLLRHITLLIGFGVYLLASGIYTGVTQDRIVSEYPEAAGYHVIELDVAMVGIVPFAESRTIASGPSSCHSGFGSKIGSAAILKTLYQSIKSWFWQFELRRLNVPIQLRKEDLIYPFHYFW